MADSRRTPAPRPGAKAPRPGGKAPRPRPPRAAGRPSSARARDAVRRRSSLTGRAAVLALVVCGLMLTLAYPVRELVAQRSRIADLREEAAAKEASVASLEAQLERWKDPAYVKAQGRERLHYAMPGETQYVVLEPDEAPAPGGAARETASPAPARPWYSDLWGSVENAAREGQAAPSGPG